MGAVAPLNGFNAGLRELAHEHGALLVMDEVMTGFRVSRAGWYGVEGVAGDLYTFGKVMSGGLPAAAFGGRADVMAKLAPLGPVYQAGTLSGNPVAVAAGTGHAAQRRRRRLRRAGREREAARRTVRRGAGQGGRAASGAVRRQPGQRVLHRGRRRARLRDRRGPPRPGGSPRSSTRCWPAASTGRRVPYEAWFVNAAMDDDAFAVIDAALPAAAEAAARSEEPSTVSDEMRPEAVRNRCHDRAPGPAR